jgi:amidohydrolase
MDLLDRAHRIASDLVELRRDIHRHPELSFQEVRTAGIAAEETAGAGYEVREGVARTGVIAEIGDGDGPTVALRADMDALPIQEKTGLPFASEVDGVMHACGHDAHTAGLIGAARILSSLHDEGKLPAGRVRLLFQPSEETSDDEGKSGAERMVEEGAMDDVDAVIGLHVGAHLPAGRVYLREGPFWGGSDELVVEVRGKGSHAARPEEGVDALVLAALGVVAAQQVVSRMTGPSEARSSRSERFMEGRHPT